MASFSSASQPQRDDSMGTDKPRRASAEDAPSTPQAVPLCWPFPLGSQNHTDKAVKLKPYVPPKRRSLNQY